MRRRPPRSTRADPLFPSTTRFRSVVLAEPQTLVRAGLRHLLEIHASAQIVGEAADGAQLLELVGRLRPDVVVTELNLPQISGLESRSEEHTSELQSLMRISYAVFCLKKKKKNNKTR